MKTEICLVSGFQYRLFPELPFQTNAFCKHEQVIGLPPGRQSLLSYTLPSFPVSASVWCGKEER